MSASTFINIESTVINGIPLVTRVTNIARLGGIGNPNTARALLELRPPSDGLLKKAILSLFISGKDLTTGFRWKVKYCGVTLSREFRPQITISSGNQSHAVLVFDITPVILRDSSRHEVNIAYDGIYPITIDSITMLTLYEHKDTLSSMNYKVGIELLEPNKSTTITMNLNTVVENNASLMLSYYIPSRSSALQVSVNEKVIGTFYGSLGVDEVETLIDNPNTTNKITLRHISKTEHTNPIRVLEAILMTVKMRKPDFNIEVVEAKPGDYIKMRIENIGEAEPDNILLVTLSRGFPFYKCNLKRLKPGEDTEIKMPHNIIRQKPFIVRVVWTKAGKTFFKDTKVDF
ncbi:MAG: hypothetical protein DRO15_03135 [Thermoprotei archaeon]|nr:MAG: hypothetical protein DRO15_03135 [Thermoprotei archaeon]